MSDDPMKNAGRTNGCDWVRPESTTDGQWPLTPGDKSLALAAGYEAAALLHLRDEAVELRAAVLEWAEANDRLEAADNAWGWAIDRGEEDVEYYATSWTHRVNHYREATDKLLKLAKSLRGERE